MGGRRFVDRDILPLVRGLRTREKKKNELVNKGKPYFYRIHILGAGRIGYELALEWLESVNEPQSTGIKDIILWDREKCTLSDAGKIVRLDENLPQKLIRLRNIDPKKIKLSLDYADAASFRKYSTLKDLESQIAGLPVQDGNDSIHDIFIITSRYNLERVVLKYTSMGKPESIKSFSHMRDEKRDEKMPLLDPNDSIDQVFIKKTLETLLYDPSPDWIEDYKRILDERKRISWISERLEGKIKKNRVQSLLDSLIGIRELGYMLGSDALKGRSMTVMSIVNEVDPLTYVLAAASQRDYRTIVAPEDNDRLRVYHGILVAYILRHGKLPDKMELSIVGPHNEYAVPVVEGEYAIKMNGKPIDHPDNFGRDAGFILEQVLKEEIEIFGHKVFEVRGSSDQDTVTAIGNQIESIVYSGEDIDGVQDITRAGVFVPAGTFPGLGGCSFGLEGRHDIKGRFKIDTKLVENIVSCMQSPKTSLGRKYAERFGEGAGMMREWIEMMHEAGLIPDKEPVMYEDSPQPAVRKEIHIVDLSVPKIPLYLVTGDSSGNLSVQDLETLMQTDIRTKGKTEAVAMSGNKVYSLSRFPQQGGADKWAVEMVDIESGEETLFRTDVKGCSIGFSIDRLEHLAVTGDSIHTISQRTTDRPAYILSWSKQHPDGPRKLELGDSNIYSLAVGSRKGKRELYAGGNKMIFMAEDNEDGSGSASSISLNARRIASLNTMGGILFASSSKENCVYVIGTSEGGASKGGVLARFESREGVYGILEGHDCISIALLGKGNSVNVRKYDKDGFPNNKVCSSDKSFQCSKDTRRLALTEDYLIMTGKGMEIAYLPAEERYAKKVFDSIPVISEVFLK